MNKHFIYNDTLVLVVCPAAYRERLQVVIDFARRGGVRRRRPAAYRERSQVIIDFARRGGVRRRRIMNVCKSSSLLLVVAASGGGVS